MRDYRFRPPREPLAKRQAKTWRPSRWVRPLASLTPIVIAGSGLLNLLSLIGGPLPNEQPRLVKGLFPLDFSHISHVATLLLGFALILTAVHLTARNSSGSPRTGRAPFFGNTAASYGNVRLLCVQPGLR